jgi:dienelactone hydrolase
MQLHLLEHDELDEARAGLTFLRTLSGVDSHRLGSVGHSFGGSLTILLADRDSALRAVVAFAPAAFSWERSPELRARLTAAVDRTLVPVLLIHAANDFSVLPGKALAAELQRRGKPHELKLYPAFGSTPGAGHNLVYLSPSTWERDVFRFLGEHLK